MGVFGGVLEEGRSLLDMIELHLHSLGRDVSMPQLTVSVTDKNAFGAGHLSCDLEEGEAAHWFLKAILCPLKFGTQGLDALRAISEMAPGTFSKADMNSPAMRSPEPLVPVSDDVGIASDEVKHSITKANELTVSDKAAVPPKLHCTYAENARCPAHEILFNPELHAVVTENLMRVSSGLFNPADKTMVGVIVAESFRNISVELEQGAPEVAAELRAIQLDEVQKDAILRLMQLIDEPRVQSIGLEVAQAIREIAAMSSKRDEMKQHIEQKLFPRRGEILKLREELIPAPLHEILDNGDQWSMTLHRDNIRVMETVSDGWSNVIGGHHEHFQAQLQATAQALAPMEASPRSLAIFAGVLEEGRALLDMLELHARSLGKDLQMPQLTISLTSSRGFGDRPVSCDLEEGKPAMWFLKSILCPLKFGTQGLDALRATSSIIHPTSAGNGVA